MLSAHAPTASSTLASGKNSWPASGSGLGGSTGLAGSFVGSAEPDQAAYYVTEYRHDEGYRISGVNPQFVGQEHFGEKVRATLAEIGENIDIVDVFRRAQDIPAHLEDILAMKPRPRVVWFQLGI